MKKALSVLLATMMLLGVLAVGASAISAQTFFFGPERINRPNSDLIGWNNSSLEGAIQAAIYSVVDKDIIAVDGVIPADTAVPESKDVDAYFFYTYAAETTYDRVVAVGTKAKADAAKPESTIKLEDTFKDKDKTDTDLLAFDAIKVAMVSEATLLASSKAGTLVATIETNVAANNKAIIDELEKVFVKAIVDKEAAVAKNLERLWAFFAENEIAWSDMYVIPSAKFYAAEKDLLVSLEIDPLISRDDLLNHAKFGEYVDGIIEILDEYFNPAPAVLSFWAKFKNWAVKYLLGGWLFNAWVRRAPVG
jgi:hypothetical protein